MMSWFALSCPSLSKRWNEKEGKKRKESSFVIVIWIFFSFFSFFSFLFNQCVLWWQRATWKSLWNMWIMMMMWVIRLNTRRVWESLFSINNFHESNETWEREQQVLYKPKKKNSISFNCNHFFFVLEMLHCHKNEFYCSISLFSRLMEYG